MNDDEAKREEMEDSEQKWEWKRKVGLQASCSQRVGE